MAASYTFDEGVEYLGQWNPQAFRTPIRFRERVLNQFRSPENIRYLEHLFATTVPPGPLRDFALETLVDSVYAFERGEDLIYSDPIAQRGGAKPAANLWSEIQRLNLAFYEQRMQFIRDKAALLTGRTGDGQWDDDEPYHYRMFVADSLRPPGLEHLNGTGPLYGIREDQTVAAQPKWPPGAKFKHNPEYRPVWAPGVEHASGNRRGSQPSQKKERFVSRAARTTTDPSPLPMDPAIAPDDWGWDSGNPNRTPAQAIAEYWGDDHVESSTLGATEVGGEAYIERYGQGDQWRENTGTRFMRYPTIPIWQNLSRGREYDREIDETLGTEMRETGNPVRRWDLSRMRNPRGEEYRRYGWRNSSTV